MKNRKRPFAVMLLALAAILVMACGSEAPGDFQDHQPSEEERLAEFSSLHNSKELQAQRLAEFEQWRKSREESDAEAIRKAFAEAYDSFADERKAEARSAVEGLVFSGEHEGLSLALDTAGVNAFEEVTRNVRAVTIKLTIRETLERALELARVKTAEELPEFVTVLDTGYVLIPGWAVGSGIDPIAGLLYGDYVLTDGSSYHSFCATTSAEDKERFIFTFTLRANADEPQWKQEVLSKKTGPELCAPEEGYPRYYPDSTALVFERPETKHFPSVQYGAIKVANSDELSRGGLVVFPTITSAGIGASYGVLTDIQESEGRTTLQFLALPLIAPGTADLGMPVYYISSDPETPLKLVAFTTNPDDPDSVSASAVSAEYYLAGVEEFPHETD